MPSTTDAPRRFHFGSLLGLGFVTDFLDTLGVGSFAMTSTDQTRLARRERTRPETLLGIEIQYPDLNGQRTALKTIENMTQAKALTNQSAPHADTLMPSPLVRGVNS